MKSTTGLVTFIKRIVSAGIFIIVIILIFPWTCPNSQAQTNITVQPSDKFSIPSYNGTVNFAVNGTYSSATLRNDTWTFLDLHLSGSQRLANLTFSTQNSNVTISSYRATNGTSFQSVRLRYVVEGQGKQILNLGLGPEGVGWGSSLEWNVIVNGNVFLALGDGWTISHDGTIVVNGARGNVSIIHYNFSGSFGNNQNSNLPLYQQHSIAIALVGALAAVVVVAVVIKVRFIKSPKNSQLGNAQATQQRQASR